MTSTSTWAAMEYLFECAKDIPLHIAPERSNELIDEIYGNEKWSFHRGSDSALFSAVPLTKSIYLTGAGQASLWCLSYVAYHVMHIASIAQRTNYDGKDKVIDISQYFSTLQLGEYISYSRDLFSTDLPWPKNLNIPIESPAKCSIDWRINNIYLGALSWILLHEIAHVHHKDQQFVPAELRKKQEFLADDFATRWILDYSENGLKLEFRILMITIALAWLFLNESELGKSATHPSAILRFREASSRFQTGELSVGLENAAYFLKAVLDPRTMPPSHDNPKEAFDWISSRLEELFSN